MLTSSVASHLHPESFYTGPLEPWVRDIQRSPDARNCNIERIVHRKCTTGMEHEFLILYAQDAAGQGVVLSVDRNASEEARFTLRASLPPENDPSSPLDSPSPEAVPAYDRVEVSHDGTADYILARHGATLCLNTLAFPPVSRPSVQHLAVLLRVIHEEFPHYAALQHQCYWFARAVFMSLAALFEGVEEPDPEHHDLQATFRGAHVSLYEASTTAIQNMLLLPVLEFPLLLIPASMVAMYTTFKLYKGHAVSTVDSRREVSDAEIRKHGIPQKYHQAWRIFLDVTKSDRIR
ncbi:uncharacterized protein STEHIDRAFT_131151 [Stereum hirsutum FP-91666 SS1]|uniref:uncharacterized protein n=1 Tax=Stereum hirsutum (strain FP-91666) TaxID=721885 RepID=UPI000440EBBC|nr:uncharacterized protein STEHIDRAFT_131151 [Stereum hirsutum FP-91666 SS1]EIM86529.1 hypothetical protein STEHIDRAFT_131151 [Stereum hirsutum FP-91666 SS1]